MDSLSQICEISFNTIFQFQIKKYRERKGVAYEI